jgi:hypothetical protein
MSTDSSQLIENNVAITDSLLYTVKPSSVRARQYKASIPASNGQTFTPQQTSIFYIPARSNCYLSGGESCIRYTIKNVNATNLAAKTDGYGSSVVNRLDFFHGSNLLESISQANVLYSLMFDTMNPAERIGVSALYGGSSDITTPRLGATLTSTSTTAAQLTVCIPLLSSICGTGLDKYLPLGVADDYRVEITWADEVTGMVQSDSSGDTFITPFTTPWVIQSPELLLNIVELDSQGQAMVNSVAPQSGETILHGTSYRSYNSSMPTNSSGGSFSTLVPARFASLQYLLLAPRLNSTVNARNGHSISNRINPNISSYFFRCGGSQIPTKPVTLINSSTTGGYSESLYEFLKCFGNSNSRLAGSSLRADYYNVAKTADARNGPVTAGNISSTPAFAIGQEFVTFSGKNDVLLSGMNTLSQNIFFECDVSSSGNDAMTLNFFAAYDILFVVQNGIMSARF